MEFKEELTGSSGTLRHRVTGTRNTEVVVQNKVAVLLTTV